MQLSSLSIPNPSYFLSDSQAEHIVCLMCKQIFLQYDCGSTVYFALTMLYITLQLSEPNWVTEGDKDGKSKGDEHSCISILYAFYLPRKTRPF